ncbi:class I SAM-dependent methyltransferase [Candidatus Avelusimicrobium fimicolum]|uniref:class I SAM-dependent methyltransferase n=1 Tax=Candidatus Avelusimicrobium fimicolum TaxID=3416216 RepID=UPI003D142C3D
MTSTQQLVQQIKEAGQDFEFYPTTKEIVYRVWRGMGRERWHARVLDIGAGNGNFFRLLEECDKEYGNDGGQEYKKYAIEKSQILISNLPADVFVIGTDFRLQTLIDKQMDTIFCNPPYSEYEFWAAKIIKEANAKQVFLVIPTRWRESPAIKQALKDRGAYASVLDTYDFLNAERAARATVHLISVYFGDKYERKSSPFDIWFEQTFKFAADTEKGYEWEEEKRKEAEIGAQLVKGQNLIERLEELYTAEMERLLQNYRAIEKLDAGILKELNVDVKKLREGLRLRLSGTKALYWKQLFDRLTTLTDRLTAKSRQELLVKLRENTSIDYTSANAYAVVLWAIKNANQYIDSQLKDLYLELSNPANIQTYKSNARTFSQDAWRFKQEKFTHYKLDYRIIEVTYKCFDVSYSGDVRDLEESARHRIDDIVTVGKNLGFNVRQSTYDKRWVPGEPQVFTYLENGEEKQFMRVKAYLNGNIHYQFCKEFSKAFNIEAGRLFGWIRNAREAAQELDLSLDETTAYFGKQQAAMLGAGQIKLLA